MNRTTARTVAGKITNKEIKSMFDLAKEKIDDWAVVSVCDNRVSKGVAWNNFAKDFDVKVEYDIKEKTKYLREFGDYLDYKIVKKMLDRKADEVKSNLKHEEPVF